MSENVETKPRLRRIEVNATEHEGRRLFVVYDPAGWSPHQLLLTEPQLFILSRFDGEHTLADIQGEFIKTFGQMVTTDQLAAMARKVDEAHLLDSPAFEAYLEGLTTAYRAAPARPMLPDSGLGCALHQVPLVLKQIVDGSKAVANGDRVVGLIAPHLDFQRGADCYADAYGWLAASRGAAGRFIVLGTNHFGFSTSVVATGKDFETPLGVAETDRDFLARLSNRCGVDLCERELDHRREHSVEMQVLFLQHCFYGKPFRIVPVLCPDPCGPTGTKPFDGRGVDLEVFAEALGEEIAADSTPTCIIAGADLSHVGENFGDDRELDEAFLRHVEQRDRKALEKVTARQPEAFRQAVAEDENSTRVCSAGSIFALMTALDRAFGASRVEANILRYHQAVNKDWETCVTCAAVAFTLKK